MTRRGTLALAGASAAVLLVACAPMLTAADCAPGGGGEMGEDAPIDAKGGVVAQDSWAAGFAPTPYSITRRTFLDCASGEGVETTIQASGDGQGTTNLTAEVDALTASVPDEGPRLAQLTEGLSLMGISFSKVSYGTEVCGCAVFYPELRGGKPRFGAST